MAKLRDGQLLHNFEATLIGTRLVTGCAKLRLDWEGAVLTPFHVHLAFLNCALYTCKLAALPQIGIALRTFLVTSHAETSIKWEFLAAFSTKI